MNSTHDSLSGRHPVNVGHLVMGVAFACLTGAWALNISGAVTGSDTRFLAPLPWVIAGVVGLVAASASRRRRAARQAEENRRRVEAADEQARYASRWDPVTTVTPAAAAAAATATASATATDELEADEVEADETATDADRASAAVDETAPLNLNPIHDSKDETR